MLDKFTDPVLFFFLIMFTRFHDGNFTDRIDEKTPVKKRTWLDPQRKLRLVEPPQGDFERDVQSQMVSDRPLSPKRSVLARGVQGPQRI